MSLSSHENKQNGKKNVSPLKFELAALVFCPAISRERSSFEKQIWFLTQPVSLNPPQKRWQSFILHESSFEKIIIIQFVNEKYKFNSSANEIWVYFHFKHHHDRIKIQGLEVALDSERLSNKDY